MIRFTVLIANQVAGVSVVTIHADGSRDATWEAKDPERGRINSRYELARDGTFDRVDTTGVDQIKRPVEEHFARAGGTSSWKNGTETGRAVANAPANYVTTQGPPELFAALVRAILAAPSHELALLPSGKGHVTQASERLVTASGRSLHVTRYEVEGLDFQPGSVWLDDDRELFADIGLWASTIREGWESIAPELAASQRDGESARLGALARKLGHVPPAPGVAIVHARLFDVETKKVVPDATIVVKEDRIIAVGATVSVPAGAETIDARGKTAIPGLWDMHQHVAPIDGLLDLANGVTGAREMGNDPEKTLRTKRAWDTGAEIGPRTVLAGFIASRGLGQQATSVFADTKEEGIADIDDYAAKGYEQIKFLGIKPELVMPLSAYAHSKGLRVSGHLPPTMNAEDAVRSGFDEVQHAYLLILGFLVPKGEGISPLVAMARVGEKAAALDLSSAAVRDLAKLLVARNAVIDPTLGALEGLFVARRGELNPQFASVAERLPLQVRRSLLDGGLHTDGLDATYLASFAKMQKLVKMFWDAGVRVVPGGDAMAGFGLHRELALYVQAGIPAADVLAMDTIGAARVVHHDKDWGSIAPGKYADVVLVDGQPDVNVSDVRKAVVVIKGGTVYQCSDLARALGMQPPPE